MPDAKTSSRSTKLRRLLDEILTGKDTIKTANAKLFLEAISNQPEPAICIQRLVGSPHGYRALQSSLSFDYTPAFLDGHMATFLHYLEADELKTICGGEVLRQVVLKVVEAVLTWESFVEAVRSKKLSENGIEAFSWLLLQLVSLPTKQAITYSAVAQDEGIQQGLLGSSQLQVRQRAHRIIHISSNITAKREPDVYGPGGRHDNDFADIRKISILPTADELASKDPFLPRNVDIEKYLGRVDGLVFYVDGQFRLLREDMMRDLREEIQIALDGRKTNRRTFSVDHLSLLGVLLDDRQPLSLQFRCLQDLPQLQGRSETARKTFLQENKKFMKHESLTCLVADGDIVTLGAFVRDEDLLAQSPPILNVRVPNAAMARVLSRIKSARGITLVQLNTAVFAYEPVLKQLQEMKELSLEDDLLRWEKCKSLPQPDYRLSPDILRLIKNIERHPSYDLKDVLKLPSQVKLDNSQAACFLAGLRQRVALIQGPPGAGKSFIGSLITKAILKYTDEKILVVCYTHHALDQFLEDLLNLDIPESDIVRLGSTKKATARTQALSLSQARSTENLTREQYAMLKLWKSAITDTGSKLRDAVANFQGADSSKSEILEHIEFLSDGPPFFDALEVPEVDDATTRVGRKGRAMDRFYLLDRWCRGKDAGIFQRQRGQRFPDVWKMPAGDRIKTLKDWKQEMLQERLDNIREAGNAYNLALEKVNAIYMEKDLAILRQKRIIGCTTTAAAKYVQSIQSVSPGVVLAEEAGEILESHILTAIGPDTKQLILIGDHKQLRPKVHYDLSVEKGDGYDLNRSLFERLIMRGYPHHVLSQQHRMRPEISALVKQLTYPDLTDAPKTLNRPDLRGFRDNLVFVNHEENEVEMVGVPDWRDSFSPSSKQNTFEAKMTLKCVRYLGQQGYRTDNIAVLTPYLGQLRLLLDELGKENDPVLNDLDSWDLVRAGLMPVATANLGKPRIRISTIDSFQGDESDIVVISLTRSNARGDIGFMASPERLNVLLSRARDALILIGNAETFMGSCKGGDLWRRFMDMLKAGNHIYDGIPVKCERHNNRVALLHDPEEFDRECPDGGCTEPCGTMLSCRIHACPQYCHQHYDHSKMVCERVVEFRCPRNHVERRKCHQSQSSTCRQCELDDQRRQKDLEAEFKMQERRIQSQIGHAEEMAKLERQIRTAREQAAENRTAVERSRALEQKKHELDTTKKLEQLSQVVDSGHIYAAPTSTADRTTVLKVVDRTAQPIEKGENASSESTQEHDPKSPSEAEWERQKRVDNAANDAIDSVMSLTGLEEVKATILSIKSKMETVARQGTDMKKERLGVVMLGNPGTGKTTVARLYAQFLTSINALPGHEFVEISGSSLAGEGVTGAKKKIDAIMSAGGGAFFLDEAYQLSSGNSPGGKAVLDFLLAEIEGKLGKIIFILAGYRKEMETFFEHNPGFDSRMPHRLDFVDYSHTDLLKILGRMVEKKYRGQAKLEGGSDGLYARILSRRVGRGRGSQGYGNVRALENAWAKVTERQAVRLHQERTAGETPNDFAFTREDLIGPEPHRAIQQSDAWKTLHQLIGLHGVKESIKAMVDRIGLNYQRELEEKPLIEVSLNRIFLGSPGTGKTTVGRLYGSILAGLGLLSKRDVVFKDPADFVGSVLGESERNTKAILKASQGKVLIIDEAYMLYPGGKGKNADIYKTAVIDTIVAEVQSTPGEDRCVLLLGYKEQMEEMLENSNPGLARRFPLNSAFQFDDFSDKELLEILEQKLRKQGLSATEEAEKVAIGLLCRARDRPNFGNAGEVENLISRAKEREQMRHMSAGSVRECSDIVFQPQDFDENFNRTETSAAACQRLFTDIVGCEKLIKKLEAYRKIAITMRARNKDPREYIPFSFIFKGPPGTGKTMVARKMAELFYEIGILPTKEYSECSASDLIAQFVGQSAPKTKDALRSALGRVLFVDEAYRLRDGEFGREAVNELVDCLTKPQFMGKLVVILAGYTEDINSLLTINPGLSSRFPEEVIFENMKPLECLALLERQLLKRGVEVDQDVRHSASEQCGELSSLFHELSSLPSWGNGRDITTLARTIAGAAFERADTSCPSVIVKMGDILLEVKSMLHDQRARSAVKMEMAPESRTDSGIFESHRLATSQLAPPDIAAPTAPPTNAVEEAPNVEAESIDSGSDIAGVPMRDQGVSDEVWQQLQQDARANELADKEMQENIAVWERKVQCFDKDEETSKQVLRELGRAVAGTENNVDKEDELKRRHEEERIHNLAIKRAREEAEAKLQKASEEAERKRRAEAQAQTRLRAMGVCPVGFRWIRQGSGYRCAGGSHFVSNAALGI